MKTDQQRHIEAFEALVDLREIALNEMKLPGNPDDDLEDLVADIMWAKKKLSVMNGSKFFKDPAQTAENSLDQMLPGRFETQMQRVEYTIANNPTTPKLVCCPNCKNQVVSNTSHSKCPICFTQID